MGEKKRVSNAAGKKKANQNTAKTAGGHPRVEKDAEA